MSQGDSSKVGTGSMLQKLLHIGSTVANEATVVGIGEQGFLGGLPVGVQRADHELLDRREEMLNELRDDYFTEGLDAVELELGELGPDVESRDLERVAEERSAVLDVVSEKMSGRILREYDTLRGALEEIGCIEESVGAAKLHIKVSREQLASASVEVRHGIAVWQNAQKKRNMSAAVDLMNKIKNAKDLLPLIREEMENEEYGLAVEHCVASAEAAAVLFPSGIQAADIISDRANDLLCTVDDQIFQSLSSMTGRFDCDRYENILKGYQLLTDPERVIGAGEVQPGQDIVSAYCNAPMMKVKKVILGVVAGKAGVNSNTESSRDLTLEDLGIPDLIAKVPSDVIKVCIGQVLRVQLEIIKSYNDLEKWHRVRQARKGDDGSMKKLLQSLEKSLPRGRGLVWNEISRSLSMVLQGSKLTQSETFLVVSRWIVQFAEVGASFSGESPLALQSLLRQQTLKFFEGFHADSIESLYLLLENEKFNLISVSLPWKVDLEEAKSEMTDGNVEKITLDECLSNLGNPWDISLQDANFDMLSDIKSLMQGSGIVLGDGQQLQATNASWRLIKRLLEYATLMKNLPAASAAIFFKLIELVDLYLLHIFLVFIDDAMPQESAMYQDLNQYIKTIVSGDLSKHVPILRAANPTSHLAELLETGIPARDSSTNRLPPRKALHSQSISNSGNLYGLVERIIVSKTMNDVTSLVVQLGPILTELLPDSDSYAVGEFIDRLTNSVEALESSIYKRGCLLMLPLAWLPAAVSSSTYQLSEPPSTAAPWTLQLKRQLELLCAQLSSVPDMRAETLSSFWKYVYPAVSSAIVDGLSQVRKCTLEGRAAMSLDLQAVGRLLNQTCPGKIDQTSLSDDSSRAIRYIDDYIKGFYVPLSELHSWAESHQSYTESQVMALAACIAESSGFKKKDIATTLMELEENLQRLQRRSQESGVEATASPQETENSHGEQKVKQQSETGDVGQS